MLKRKLGLAVAAILCVGLMTSCININDNRSGGDNEVVNGIDYKDYSGGSYSIKVKNDSTKNVVCFQNTPRESNLISGVKAGAQVGLKKNSLFSATHDFILFVVTEDDYLKNKNNLQALDNNPFATIYAYYNAESAAVESNMVYHISKFMGGESYIIIDNMEKYNVELRENGLYGESIAFAGAGTVNTKINMLEGSYTIFPVFRKYSSRAKEIITTFPKYTVEGEDYPVVVSFSLNSSDSVQRFNVSTWFDKNAMNATEAATAAYVTIHNGNAGTGVSLYEGGTADATETSTGGKFINTSKSLVFEVPMQNLGSNRYSKTATVTNWQIGIPASGLKRATLPTIDVEAGKMYYIEVAGNNYADLTAVWKMNDDGTPFAEDTGFEDEESTIFR